MGKNRLVALGILGLLPYSNSYATLSVKAESPYVRNDNSRIYYWGISGGASYASTQLGTGLIDLAGGYKILDLTETGALDTDGSSLIAVDVSSDTDFNPGSGEFVGISVYAKRSDGTHEAIPIAASSVNSSGTPTNCTGANCGAHNGTYYFTAFGSNGQSTRVGVNLTDICAFATTTNGCDSTSTVGSPFGTEKVFYLKVVSALLSNTSSTVPSNASETDSVEVALAGAAPRFTCPATDSDFSNSYYPTDAAIYMNPDSFFPTKSSYGAPLDKFIVMAHLEHSVDQTYTFRGNSVVGYVTPGSGVQRIEGFQNSTVEQQFTYYMGVMLRDQSGWIARSGTSGNCQVADVQTSAIQGFLKKDDCFIATAASSKRSWVVKTLRHFRDRFLSRTLWGRNFILWYQKHSPPKAQWLNEHSALKPLVLALLLPIALSVFLLLNPLVATGVVALIGGAIIFRTKKKK